MLRLALILLVTVLMTFLSSAQPQAQTPRANVTFTEHVAPIVLSVCAACHRPGEAAPFSLLTYDDVRKRGKLIASVTQSKYMPPWHADSDLGSFRDDRRLTEAQIRTIQDWVQAGMPEGDPREMP